MNRWRPILMWGVALVVGGLIARWIVVSAYLAPRKELRADIASITETIDGYQRQQMDAVKLRRAVDDIVTRTLGGDAETVDHRLRTRLSAIAGDVGLAGTSVTTRSPSMRGSPARSAMLRRGPWKELRDEPDFAEVAATISGEGTLTQVVELTDRLAAEPWMKLITGSTITPRNDATTFRVAISLVTLFLPGREPDELTVADYDSTRLGRYASLTSVNPFRLPVAPSPPEPAPEPTAVTPPTPPPTPTFPWEEWSVTGLAATPAGPEVWLRNSRSGETSVLVVGSAIGEAVLVEVRTDSAVFRIEDERYAVGVGETLAQRVGLDR